MGHLIHHHAHSNGSKAPTGAAGSAVNQTAALAAAASGTNGAGTLAEGQTTAVQPYGAHVAHAHHHDMPSAGGHSAGGQPPASAPEAGGPAGPAPVAVRGTLFPAIGTIVQAGAFGAALGGISSGVTEVARVKQGEISSEEAIRNVVKSATQGATTMAVASIAGHMVRSYPVVGFLVLATAGIGALAVLSNSKPVKKAAVAKARVSSSGAKPAKKPAAASAILRSN